MTLPPFLAVIPLPILVGIPIVGLAIGVGVYEYNKHKLAAAALATAAPGPALAPAPNMTIAAPAPAPTGPLNPILVKAAQSWPVGSPQYNRLMAAAAGPQMIGLVHAAVHAAAPPAPAGAPTGVLAQAQQSAQQILSGLPSPFPGDVYQMHEQIVKAALGQFIANPTFTQFSTTLTNLQQDGSGPAVSAHNTLNRYMQTLQT